jgi:hypothetical protein
MVAPASPVEESYPASQVYDRCETCNEQIRGTDIVFSPVWYSALALFERWEAHIIDRAEFDRSIGKLFSSGNMRQTHVS